MDVLSLVIAFTTIAGTVSQIDIYRFKKLPLSSFTSISVDESLPVRLEDEHHLSTVWGQLNLLNAT